MLFAERELDRPHKQTLQIINHWFYNAKLYNANLFYSRISCIGLKAIGMGTETLIANNN
jgi:hypothetical protein